MPNSFLRDLLRLDRPNAWTPRVDPVLGLTDLDILEVAHAAAIREGVMERRLDDISTDVLLQPIYDNVERAR